MPYLALPALTGFLRAHNIAVIQRDLNVETYDAILSRAHLEQTLKKLRAEFSGRRTLPAPIEWAFAHGSQLAAKINAAKEIFRSQAFYDGEKSLDAFTTIAQSLELASLPFQPAQLDFLHFIPASPVDSSCDLLAGVRDAKHNLFLDMFKRGIVADIAREKPDIVGISIPTEGQMVAAFTLAHLIKQAGLKCHVTIGGPHVSMLREQIPHAPLLFDVIDSAVIFDGEMALLKLSEAIEGKCTMSDVPNLIHRADGTIHTNATAMHPDALTQVTPDFDGLPLKTYFVPDLVLPLITAHGCYHGLCAFCNVGYGAGKGFAPMDVERLLAQILSVHKKYNCRHIFFTDEAMPPRTMRLLAERLANLGPPIVWTSCARFEKAISAELLRDAARGGCVMLLFGLETASERMIQLMVKGTQRETMSRLLQEGTQAGIWNHTFSFSVFLPRRWTTRRTRSISFMRIKTPFTRHRRARSCWNGTRRCIWTQHATA